MILQATPLVVVAGAAIFFNEKVGVVRWVSYWYRLRWCLVDRQSK